jgi:hypothetical protein
MLRRLRAMVASVESLREIAGPRGIPLHRMIAGFVAARRRNPTLAVGDYLAYGLFPRSLVKEARPEDFIGRMAQTDLAEALNPRVGVLPGWDKLALHLYALAFDLPVPALRSVYLPGARPVAAVAPIAFDDPEALGHWLRRETAWPLFAKPSFGQQSIGCHHFVDYLANEDALLTHSGQVLPVETFLSEVRGEVFHRHFRPEMGYLFQEVLRPHQELVRLFACRQISGVRVVLIRDQHGVEIVSALLKVAQDGSDTDRFEARNEGNFVADVEPETGRVRLARSMKGRVTHAPRTGIEIVGAVLPDWDEAIGLCRRAAGVFPLMRIQHWDVALTDVGPRLLEVNDIGAIGWLQAFGHGIVTPRLRELLRREADPQLHPWVRGLCR